jgi:hypothetical protein
MKKFTKNSKVIEDISLPSIKKVKIIIHLYAIITTTTIAIITAIKKNFSIISSSDVFLHKFITLLGFERHNNAEISEISQTKMTRR